MRDKLLIELGVGTVLTRVDLCEKCKKEVERLLLDISQHISTRMWEKKFNN